MDVQIEITDITVNSEIQETVISCEVIFTTSGGGVEEAPIDDVQYGRQNAAWTPIGAASVTKENVGAAVDTFDASTPTDTDYIILGGKKKTLVSALKTLFKTANDLLYEPIITKLTAFNKNFGTTAGTVLEGRTFGSAADSETTDFAAALTNDQNYVSDAELVVLQNTSNTNTGDNEFSTDIETDKASTTKISAIKTFYDWTVGKFATIINLALKRDKTEQGDAHGFVNPPNASNFTVSNVGSSVTVNLLTNAGNYKINGADYVNSGLSITFTASLGQNFINLNASGLVNNAFDILDLSKIACCTINWDGTTAILADELHSSRRNLIEHKKQHDTDGGRWVSGGVTTFGSSANNTFSSLESVIRDEDRYHTIAGTRTQGMIIYRNSALTAMIADAASTRFCKLVNTTTGAPYYDLNGTLTALNNNQYGIYWMYATNRKLPVNSEIVFVVGQGTYSNVSNAQNAAQPTLSGMTVAEWKLMYRIIVRNVGGTLLFMQADDLRLTTTGLAVSGSGVTSLPATQITETNYGNVQVAINALKVLQVTEQTLTAANWTLVSGLYEYDLANANITATKFVEVIPDNATIEITKAAELLPTNISSAGSVKLYSKNLPTANIVVTINIYE